MWQKRINIAVIVLISLLVVSLGIPRLVHLRQEARKTQSKNNLKQLGLALYNYVDVYQGFPPGGIFKSDGRGYHGWMTSILPYLEASPFYSFIDLNEPWDSTNNAGLFLNKKPAYENEGEPENYRRWEFPVAHYCANAHLMAANSFNNLKSIEDTERSFLVGELDGSFVPWGCPYNWRKLESINQTPPIFGRSTRDGCFFLFADAHVEFITNSISKELLLRMNGPDLTEFESNPLCLEIPSEFPCPADTLQITWDRSGGGVIKTGTDIHGNIKFRQPD